MTPKQQRFYDIVERLNSQGNPPTIIEMCKIMGFKHDGSARQIFMSLHLKGLMKKDGRKIILTSQPKKTTIEA